MEKPDDLMKILEMVRQFGRNPPKTIVDFIKWALRNPEELRDLATRYNKLCRTSKRSFEELLRCEYDPLEAMSLAEKKDEEYRNNHRCLRKIVVAAKKDGYKMTLSNGVPCVVKKEGAHYRFDFTVGDSVISMWFADLASVIYEITYCCLLPKRAVKVLYQGNKIDWKDFHFYYKAVERNMRPELVALMEGRT